VVAWDVKERHVEAGDDVLEVVEGKIATTENDVGLEPGELVTVEAFVDLVRDRKDAGQVMPAPLGAV
jgi:hypothetical protein